LESGFLFVKQQQQFLLLREQSATGFFSTSGVQTTDPRYAYPFPFWLPSGATFGYSGISSNTNITFFALEFNVIP
jgi:hypothetical protein